MKVLVVVSAVLAVAAAQFLSYPGWAGYAGYPYANGWWNGAYGNYAGLRAAAATPLTYSAFPYRGYNYAAYPHAAPAVASSQYHAQDAIGGYNYGYADGLSTKHESKNVFGATVGSYSYLDSNGKVQTVNYVADAAGYRATGTNLPVADQEGPAPVDYTPEVKAARAEHASLYSAAAAAAAAGATPVVTVAGPAPVQDTAEVRAAKAEFGRLYAEAAAAAAAAPDARKKRSAPEPVDYTPEVKAARAEHALLYSAAAAAAAAAPDFDYYPRAYAGYPYTYSAFPYTAAAGSPALAYSGVRPGFSYGFNSAHFPYFNRYFY